MNRRGLYALSPGSKIPLLCYLTDYTLTGVLEPGLVDIFNHGEKVWIPWNSFGDKNKKNGILIFIIVSRDYLNFKT